MSHQKTLISFFTAALLFGAACQTQTGGPDKMKIEAGSNVKIHYTLKVEGSVVDSSQGKDPLAYKQGQGQLVPGVEAALSGLAAGDKKTFEVEPEQGYGLPDPKAVQSVPKDRFKDPAGLAPGAVVSGQQNGRSFQARIVEVNDKEVTLDLNHPLAGKTLNFQVEVVEVTGG